MTRWKRNANKHDDKMMILNLIGRKDYYVLMHGFPTIFIDGFFDDSLISFSIFPPIRLSSCKGKNKLTKFLAFIIVMFTLHAINCRE